MIEAHKQINVPLNHTRVFTKRKVDPNRGEKKSSTFGKFQGKKILGYEIPKHVLKLWIIKDDVCVNF